MNIYTIERTDGEAIMVVIAKEEEEVRDLTGGDRDDRADWLDPTVSLLNPANAGVPGTVIATSEVI